MTSFMAAAILLPASMLISCARAAISATVSFTSAPRWPGLRFGGTGGTAVAVAAAVALPVAAAAGIVATAGLSLSLIIWAPSSEGWADGLESQMFCSMPDRAERR